MEGFNKGLYDHLNNRPEYETAKMYDSLKARIDVDDPLKEEFARNRERIENNTGPAPDQTPGEVIDAVLLALQDVDFPTENHGVELLKKYTGDGSQLADEQNVTPEILRGYFESTKYGILISWVAVQYLKKIEISLDGQRASQEVPMATLSHPPRGPTQRAHAPPPVSQVKLKSPDGDWVPVRFQLGHYETAAGKTWLIDQFLVKSAERRGDAY